MGDCFIVRTTESTAKTTNDKVLSNFCSVAEVLLMRVALGAPRPRGSLLETKVLRIKFKLKTIHPRYPAETTERRKSQS